MSVSRIIQLAQRIASETQKLDDHLAQNELPQPSFAVGAPIEPFLSATPDITEAKSNVVEAAIELRHLLEGPVQLLLPEVNLSPPLIPFSHQRTRSQISLLLPQYTVSISRSMFL